MDFMLKNINKIRLAASFFLLGVVTLIAIWYVGAHFSQTLNATHMNDERQLFICYLIIASTSILWARMTYQHYKVMEKLEQIEKMKDGKQTEKP